MLNTNGSDLMLKQPTGTQTQSAGTHCPSCCAEWQCPDRPCPGSSTSSPALAPPAFPGPAALRSSLSLWPRTSLVTEGIARSLGSVQLKSQVCTLLTWVQFPVLVAPYWHGFNSQCWLHLTDTGSIPSAGCTLLTRVQFPVLVAPYWHGFNSQCCKFSFFSLPESASTSSADSLTVLQSPYTQSYASTSVWTLKIPKTGSHTIVWTHENMAHTDRNG